MWSSAHHPQPRPFRQNRLLQVYLFIFGAFWFYTFAFTTDLNNWFIENTMTTFALSMLALTYRRFNFSDTSYTLILIFTLLHVYGSQYTYSENPLGDAFKDLLNLERNHYDRFVHFSFGLLAWYPLFDFFRNHFKWPGWICKMLPVSILLSFSALYEIVEWAVAEYFFPEQGMAYLGTQGDAWDGVKDMALAFSGTILAWLWLRLTNNGKKA